MGAAAVLSGGCFTYVPAELGSVPVGEDVRVRLAQLGVAANLPEATDENRPSVRGRVMSKDAGSLLLRVPVGVQQDGLVTRTFGQQISIPVGEILEIQRRQLNWTRTRVTVAGGALALVAGLVSFGNGRPNPEQQPDEPEVELGGRVHGTLSVAVPAP